MVLLKEQHVCIHSMSTDTWKGATQQLQKKCCIHSIYLSGIPILKIITLLSLMIHIHMQVINSVNQWDWWPYQVISLWGHLMKPTLICHMRSSTHAWSWNELHVSKTCSLASKVRPGRTVCKKRVLNCCSMPEIMPSTCHALLPGMSFVLMTMIVK